MNDDVDEISMAHAARIIRRLGEQYDQQRWFYGRPLSLEQLERLMGYVVIEYAGGLGL